MTPQTERRAGSWERHLTTALVSISVVVLSALGAIAWEMNNALQVIPAEMSAMRGALSELKVSVRDISNGYLPRTEAEAKFEGLHREQEVIEKRVSRLEDKTK